MSSLPPIGRPSSSEKSRLQEQLENPFRLPSDDQIFRKREEERKEREDNRKRSLNLRVWEKANANHEIVSTSDRLKEIIGDGEVMKLKDALKATNQEQANATKFAIPRRQEKENTSEFVAKKREMFLVQMSLDTKREEIRKLEEKAQMKEEALQRSEQMLEEDAMRFDAFLKENDKKAHDAIKRAEEETKKKQEKQQDIKRLTQQIQSLSSEMSKHREALDDCLKYKSFLDMLTPPEWFEQHRLRREQRIKDQKQSQYDEKHKEWEKLKRKLIEQHRKEIEAKKELKKERNRRNRGSNQQQQQQDDDDEDENENRLIIPQPPKFEDEIVDLPEEEVPMYFTDPVQLMDIFSALEEQNLFLIQNSQETEHTLEELQHAFSETKLSMDAQTSILQQQIDELQLQINFEESRVKTLVNKRMNANEETMKEHASNNKGKDNKKPGSEGKDNNSNSTTNNLQSQVEKEKLLTELNNKVKMVYEKCHFDASSKPSTLFMLSQLESKLEFLLQDIERMPTEYVIKAEKEKEKRRREKKREEQQALQERLQEERNKRAIERSMQAPKKRFGRQVMYRSKPLRAEEKKNGDDDNDKDNTDELKYLS
jgi:hypothetical protein